MNMLEVRSVALQVERAPQELIAATEGEDATEIRVAAGKFKGLNTELELALYDPFEEVARAR